MAAPIITLTADWGINSFFAGMVKGRLLRSIPDAKIIDICLDVQPFDRQQAAFIVSNACREFPDGTIHIIDVDAIGRQPCRHIVAHAAGGYYIATDNGLPGVALDGTVKEVVALNTGNNQSTFASYDYYCDAAALIAHGMPLSEIGQPCPAGLLRDTRIQPSGDTATLYATIVYIDAYGNAYLNITYNQFEEIRAGRRFRALAKDTYISNISTAYNTAQSSGLLLTVSATGFLQLVLLHRSAHQLYGFSKGDQVRFTFRDE